jgi:general secretion pathway protein B
MSFILDALRKSERERQRNEAPGIAGVQVQSRSNSRSIWAPLVVLLVAVNIVLLLFLWVKGTPDDDAIPGQNSAVAERSTTPPAATNDRQLTAVKSVSKSPVTSVKKPSSSSPPVSTAAKRPSTPAAANGSYSGIATFTELTLAGSLELKPLHLDIHVFSEQPAERFVFINMSKYREGSQLSEGPTVNAITAVGVVLNYQGRDFLLTRQ